MRVPTLLLGPLYLPSQEGSSFHIALRQPEELTLLCFCLLSSLQPKDAQSYFNLKMFAGRLPAIVVTRF